MQAVNRPASHSSQDGIGTSSGPDRVGDIGESGEPRARDARLPHPASDAHQFDRLQDAFKEPRDLPQDALTHIADQLPTRDAAALASVNRHNAEQLRGYAGEHEAWRVYGLRLPPGIRSMQEWVEKDFFGCVIALERSVAQKNGPRGFGAYPAVLGEIQRRRINAEALWSTLAWARITGQEPVFRNIWPDGLQEVGPTDRFRMKEPFDLHAACGDLLRARVPAWRNLTYARALRVSSWGTLVVAALLPSGKVVMCTIDGWTREDRAQGRLLPQNPVVTEIDAPVFPGPVRQLEVVPPEEDEDELLLALTEDGRLFDHHGEVNTDGARIGGIENGSYAALRADDGRLGAYVMGIGGPCGTIAWLSDDTGPTVQVGRISGLQLVNGRLWTPPRPGAADRAVSHENLEVLCTVEAGSVDTSLAVQLVMGHDSTTGELVVAAGNARAPLRTLPGISARDIVGIHPGMTRIVLELKDGKFIQVDSRLRVKDLRWFPGMTPEPLHRLPAAGGEPHATVHVARNLRQRWAEASDRLARSVANVFASEASAAEDTARKAER